MTSGGEKKRVARALNWLLFAPFLLIISFVAMFVDEVTIYDRSPVYHDTITISETEFVRVESFRGASHFECEIHDEKTTIPFVFSSTDRDEAKRFCDELDIGSKQKLTFKDVRGSYSIVLEEK